MKNLIVGIVGTPLDLYVSLLDELLRQRAVGDLDDAAEERFAVQLNDYRYAMTTEEEAKIVEIIAQRKAIDVRPGKRKNK